jgi:hypothetical protein
MGKDYLAVGLMGAIAGCVGAVLALDAIEHTRVRSQLQNVADSAALAGVLALASNQETADAQRAATLAATQDVEKRTHPGAVAFLVEPSKSDMTVSVRLAEPESSKLHSLLYGPPTDVVGHANYLPATDPQPQTANRLQGWRSYAQSEH